MRGVRCSGFNLAVLYIPVIEREKTRLYIVATKDKTMGLVYINWILFVYIMSLFSKHYSVCMNLIPREASIEALSKWSNSGRCRQGPVYLFMDVMPICKWSLSWISHNYALFYQLPNSNLFTHRMLPTWEMPLENTMASGSIHLYIRKRYYYLAAFIYLLFYFAIIHYYLLVSLACK